METTIMYWGSIGIMEKNMETTIMYWGSIGIMEKKMETTIMYWGSIGIIETYKGMLAMRANGSVGTTLRNLHVHTSFELFYLRVMWTSVVYL